MVFNLPLHKPHVALNLKLVGHDLPEQHQDQPGVRQEDADLLLAKSEPLEVRGQKVDQQHDRNEVAPDKRKLEHRRISRREHKITKPLLLRIHHCGVTGQLVKPRLVRLAVAQLVDDADSLGRPAVLRAGQLHVRAVIAIDRDRLGSRKCLDSFQPKLPAPTVDVFLQATRALGQFAHGDGSAFRTIHGLKLQHAELGTLDLRPVPLVGLPRLQPPVGVAHADLSPSSTADRLGDQQVAAEIFFLRVV